MKKLLLAILAAVVSVGVSAQSIRTNYRAGGITHISTDYEPMKAGDVPVQLRLELAAFPDGSTLYLLYMNLVQKTAVVVPKGVKMALTLQGGKIVRLEQIGEDTPTKRRLDDGTVLNRLKYAVEPAEMEKLVKGVKSVDIITGWNPDDYIQANWNEDVLGELLKRHCEAIREAAGSTVDLNATLAAYTDGANSILSTSNPVVARGNNMDYNVILSHLYYKNNNQEDLDLAFVLGTEAKYHIPYDAPVRFTLGNESVITLQQARDDVNFVYVYPTLDQLQRMASQGITGLSIDYEGGTLADSFGPREDGAPGFAAAVNQQLQLLLSLSPR